METRRDADKARAMMKKAERIRKMRDVIRQEKGRVKSKWRKVMRSLFNECSNRSSDLLKSTAKAMFLRSCSCISGAMTNMQRPASTFMAVTLLLCITLLASPQNAEAATALLAPNGTGTEGGGNEWQAPEASPGGNWANWSADDGLSTVNFVTNNGSTDHVTVAVTDPGLTTNDKINSITVFATCQGTGDPAPILWGMPGGNLEGAQMIVTGAYAEYSHTFPNPGGGSNWTNTDLAGTEIGMDQLNGGKGDTYCTKVEALLDYTSRAQTMDSFVDTSYDEYTPVSDVQLAKIKTSAAASQWGFDLTSVDVTLGGSLSTTGPINVYWATTDDFATAQGGGTKGTCASPVIDTPCNISLDSSIYQETGYLFFTIDLVSETLGDYYLTISDFTGDSADLIGLPKTTQTRSVKPPTQSLDYWYDYAKNFMTNSAAPASDILLARIDTNLTSEGKSLGTTYVNISGTMTPGKLTDIKVWWKNYTTGQDGDYFPDATVVGTALNPTMGSYTEISMAGAGKSKGYIYYSMSMTDGGTTGSYAINVANVKDASGVLVEDFLYLPQVGSTSKVTDPYAIQVCGDCHAYPPLESALRGTPAGTVLGTHSTHSRFNPMRCTTCHGDTTSGETNPAHRNGLVQLPDRAPLSIAYDKGTSFAQSTSPQPFGTCTPLCHNGNTRTWGQAPGSLVCDDCHLTTGADVDDFTFDYFTSTAVPRLKDAEWTGRGHGKDDAGTYAYTGNPDAALACTNCHNEGIPHGDRIIPFRTLETGNMDFFCQNCHGTPVEIGSLFTPISTSASAKGIKTHSQEVFEEEGYKTLTTWRIAALKCIDCHDPHGDNNNAMIHDKVWTGGSNGKGRPEPFLGASTVVFVKATGIGGFAMGDNSTNTYICEVCHTRTDFHTQGGNGIDHNNGIRCPDCHRHNKGWAPYEKCTECHAVARNYVYNVRQIVADSSGTGGDFMKLSRHVSDGSTNEIVTAYDCVVCHREGDYAKINSNQGFKSDTLHNNGSTSTTRMVDLRNVDSPDTGWQFNKNVIDETMRTDMDTFCMTCHDADGAAGLAVNSGDNGMDTTPVSNGTNLAPFNSNDAIRNGNDGFTTRTRVVDVSSQFDTSNPSHHAVKGARYTTQDSNWNSNTVWNTSHTLRNGNAIDSGSQRDMATLHCSDCHLSEQNAHGAATAWYMLLNGTANDFTNEETLTGQSASGNPASIVCYKCHNSGVYSSSAGNGSRYDHNDETRMWAATEGGTEASKLGMACFLCHAGDGFGHIHGRGSATDGDNGTYNTGDVTNITKRRFMPGGHFYWDPGDGEAWASASASSGCYFPEAGNEWSTCVKHAGGYGGDSPSQYARPINY